MNPEPDTHKNLVPIIGLAGGSGSGKTTLADALAGAFSSPPTLLSQDRYYRDLSALSVEERRSVNYDHPDALESELLARHLSALQQGCAIEAPVYDFTQHSRAGYEPIAPATWVLLEGTLVYALPDIQPLIDFRIFVDCPADARLLRRLRRDIAERGRTFEFCAQQWQQTVKPMYAQFIEPHKARADLVIDGNEDINENVKKIQTAMQSLSGAS